MVDAFDDGADHPTSRDATAMLPANGPVQYLS